MEILKKYWKFILAYGLLVIVLIFLLYYYREVYELVREMIRFFSSRKRLNAYVASYGSYAPAVFLGLQILQVLFAPIPGELTGFIGGFLFGVGPGFIYSTIGLTLGSLIAFTISRYFGMPFVRKFVGQEVMAKFDYLMEHKGAFFSFIFFLVPGTPKDYFCYLLGLSPMHVVTFMIISTIGRSPHIAMPALEACRVTGRICKGLADARPVPGACLSATRARHRRRTAALAAFAGAILFHPRIASPMGRSTL